MPKKFNDIVRNQETELNALVRRHYRNYARRKDIDEGKVNGFMAETERLVKQLRKRIIGRGLRVGTRLQVLDIQAQIAFFQQNPDAPAPAAPSGLAMN